MFHGILTGIPILKELIRSFCDFADSIAATMGEFDGQLSPCLGAYISIIGLDDDIVGFWPALT